MRIPASLFLLLLIATTRFVLAEEDELTQSFNSPDGRFALTVNPPATNDGEAKLAVIEKASGKVVGDLGTEHPSIMGQIKVVWSADSKRLAYRTAGSKEWSTDVYFWNSSAFLSIALPEELPSPEIKFRKSESGSVKNYGGGVEPVRWLKSGDLELLSQETQFARESSRTYTATITITIGFDAQQHASVKSVSKSKTHVE
ncbi:MAG: hypothetical protein ABI883_04020 [Chthoniobacterales bacterium]